MREVAAAWDDLGDEIMGRWLVDNPCTRPWGWWQFDAPEPRGDDETDAAYLQRHGLLTEPERLALRPSALTEQAQSST